MNITSRAIHHVLRRKVQDRCGHSRKKTYFGTLHSQYHHQRITVLVGHYILIDNYLVPDAISKVSSPFSDAPWSNHTREVKLERLPYAMTRLSTSANSPGMLLGVVDIEITWWHAQHWWSSPLNQLIYPCSMMELHRLVLGIFKEILKRLGRRDMIKLALRTSGILWWGLRNGSGRPNCTRHLHVEGYRESWPLIS